MGKKQKGEKNGLDLSGESYAFRDLDNPHEVTAVELVDSDIEPGDARVAGDFMVTREGYAPQWWKRADFLAAYDAV